MAALRPLAPDAVTGIPKQIQAPDTIDASILPTSSTSSFAVDGGTATTPGTYVGTLRVDFGGAT